MLADPGAETSWPTLMLTVVDVKQPSERRLDLADQADDLAFRASFS
jgi:hypothetical protein